MGAEKKPRLILLLLFAAFAVPPLLSWWLFHYTNTGRDADAGEHATLVSPPRAAPNWKLVNPAAEAGGQAHLHGKWSLVYPLNGKCGEDCRRNLYRMRQLRLAAGKYAARVQRVVLVVNNDAAAVSRQQLAEYAGQLLLFPQDIDAAALAEMFRLAPDDRPFEHNRLYLLDPLGNLVVSYAAAAEPAAIISNLKRLLKYSRLG